MDNKRSNKGLYSIVIIFMLLSFSCGVFACLYYNEVNKNKELTEKINNNNNNSNTTNESNNAKEESNKEETTQQEEVKAYVGIFNSIDHCDGCVASYIKLNDDNTYERNQNDCSAISTIVGEYSVTASNNDTIITFISARYQDGLAINEPHNFSFKYKDNKLSIIDDTNTYAFYDCSNSRTFKK